MIETLVFFGFILFVFALIMNRPPKPGAKQEIAMWDAAYLEDKSPPKVPRDIPLYMRGWRTPEITRGMTEFGDQIVPLWNGEKGHRGVSMKRLLELQADPNHRACLVGPARRIFRERGDGGRGLRDWFLGGVPAEVRPWFHVKTEIGGWLVSEAVTSPWVFVASDAVVLICGARNEGGVSVRILWPDEMRAVGLGQSGGADMIFGAEDPPDDRGVYVRLQPGDELRIPEGFGQRVGGLGRGGRVCLQATMDHPASLVRRQLTPYTFRRLKGVLPEDQKSLHIRDNNGSGSVIEGDSGGHQGHEDENGRSQ